MSGQGAKPFRNLILGGVKSGKSRFAEAQARALSEHITLIATAEALDAEMQARIQRHQQDRPVHWKTVEEPVYLAQALEENKTAEVVIVDCLTLWLSNLLMREDEALLQEQIGQFKEVVAQFESPLFLVANETNMGIMPIGELTRRFCDEAGKLHQALAERCQQVDLVVAGLPLNLKASP